MNKTSITKSQIPNTLLEVLLNHITPGSLKEIGCGSYARVYKMEYKRCATPAENCRFCLKIPLETNEVCLKQFYMSNLYDNEDYECEIKYQQQVYNKYPGMIVRIYDSWLHETPDIPELQQHVLKQPFGSAQADNIFKTGFILTELMNDLDLHNYFKKIGTVSTDLIPITVAANVGLELNDTTHYKTPKQIPYINMLGLMFILINIVYIIHYEFNITHGDMRDRNIFLRYHNPDWRQVCSGGYLKDQTILIDTGGWEIKLGDFGLADTIYEGEGSFIIRDYEFLDNIYCCRNKWRHTCSGLEFNNIISFIKHEFLANIYERINKYRREGQTITEARHTFWFNKHRIGQNSMFLYELPQRLLLKLILFPPYKNILPITYV